MCIHADHTFTVLFSDALLCIEHGNNCSFSDPTQVCKIKSATLNIYTQQPKGKQPRKLCDYKTFTQGLQVLIFTAVKDQLSKP